MTLNGTASSTSQTGIVDQHVDGAPLGGQVGNHLFNGRAVTHVQLRGQDAVA